MLKAEINVPLYGDTLLLVLSADAIKSRKAFNKRFGESTDGQFSGLCSSNGYHFGLFFDALCFNHQLIAHEVFHVTHRILEYNSVTFSTENHEPFAFLCGWITGWVYAVTKNVPMKNPRRHP